MFPSGHNGVESFDRVLIGEGWKVRTASGSAYESKSYIAMVMAGSLDWVLIYAMCGKETCHD